MSGFRVLVGQIWQESHSFNPQPTGREDFAVEYGFAVLETHRSSGSTLGGLIRHLDAAGCELLPTLAARARPGGPVAHDFYAELKRTILDAAAEARPDAVVFELHGAMSTTELHDVEGDLTEALREVLGPGPIVGIGVDLHAHITPRLLRSVDICTACKENPHSDVVEAGERAAALVLAALAEKIKPTTACVRLPMLLQGGSETTERPLADLHALARSLTADYDRLLDVSIFNVHPFNDAPGIGQVVLAITDGDGDLAGRVCRDIAVRMWDWRDAFRSEYLTIDDAIDLVIAERSHGPYVVSDRGDRVLAGAPGDSTVILKRLLERDLGLRVAIPVTDAASVERAWAAGVGATVELCVGGHITPGFEPLPICGQVLRLSDGHFIQKGPYQAGQPSTLGRTAVIALGPITLILTSVAGMTQDPAAFTSQGIDISKQDFVVAKSGNHFKLSFRGVAEPLVVDTPGIGAYRPGFFQYRNARPIYPEDQIQEINFEPSIFGRTEASSVRDYSAG